MILRLIIRTVLWLAVTAALLFLPAATVGWPGAWVMLGELASVAAGIGLWLCKHDPRLLRERMGSIVQRQQEAWDRLLMTAVLLLWTAGFVLMGADVARNGLSQVPVWLQAFGGLGIPFCGWLAFLTHHENSYAAPVVKIPEDRRRAVTTGPYRLLRHPLYPGAIALLPRRPAAVGIAMGARPRARPHRAARRPPSARSSRSARSRTSSPGTRTTRPACATG